jgi:uncharacterized integral membrane protein
LKTNGRQAHNLIQDNTKFLVIFGVLIIIIVIDISIVRLYDSVSKNFLPVDTKEVLFAVTSASCVVAGIILLEFVKPQRVQDQLGKKVPIWRIYRTTKMVQYALGVVLGYIVFQILVGSSYSTYALIIAIGCTYTLSIGILAIFVARMTTTLLAYNRKAIIMILFVLALGNITVNMAITVVDVSLRLLDRPTDTRVYVGGSMDVSKGKYVILDNLYFLSYLASFFTAWISTTAMLSFYAKRVGKLWFWLLTASPIVFFLAQFVTLLTPALSNTVITFDPFLVAGIGTLIGTIVKPVSGLMLALSFWILARTVGRSSPLRIYLIISGLGLLLLFATNQAILLSIAPYPPFGFASITLTGLSAYLAVVGIYTSSISMSNDAKILKSIRSLAKSESRLLDSIASAEMQKEIESRVIKVVKAQSSEIEDQTGSKPSLTDDEIKGYLDKVLKEIKR